MNLNVKLDGEEEQPLQYLNRFAINIPTGAAAINLNIVNPGLGNQSYILNPVNPVGQNIVTYQPQMALQSYIALPTEGEGNILHSLPVGVPVVSGLPVATGLLQNNFVNTSIIIGNEDCNSSGVLKSSTNNLNAENEIKINYIEKPVDDLAGSKANGIEVQNIGINCSSQTNSEAIIKKPCPLEMSIKAANIDIEFEKCEPEVPILLGNCQTIVEKPLIVENMEELKDNLLKVPLEISSVQTPNVQTVKETESKKTKTEITWENNNKEEAIDNGFQESLICEVEEANDDDEEEEEEEVEEEEEDEEEDEDEEEESEEEVNSNCKATKSGVNSNEGVSSSEESDSLPLSVALKLTNKSNKPHRRRNKKGRNEISSREKVSEDGRKKKKSSVRNKQKKEEDEDEEEDDEDDEKEEEDGENWSESDDDVLNLKRIKNEFNYKCFYEPNSMKSATSLVLKLDDKFKKFVRVRSCCSKRECGKKISVQDQKTAHKNFYDLESNAKRDAYLMNCIEHVQKSRNVENAKDKTDEKYLERTNIQLEIENESNGNQKLSDEIQKAINESLKDCVANERINQEEFNDDDDDDDDEKGEKNTWNFYIVIERCRKKVCLQFLLKLFQINKSRIKQLQKKMLSGTTTAEELGKGNSKLSDVWEVAKTHLDSLNGFECKDCNSSPRHRFLSEKCTKEDLFNSFKEFYFNKLGKEPNIKYASYKRFLEKKTSISFSTNKEGICIECEELKRNRKRKQKKTEKGGTKSKKKESKKQWVVKTDSEDNSSDDEPLLKRKKLKLTIPLKAVNNKNSGTVGKRNNKKYSIENKNKGKTKQSGSRGRDVWSLMLLHLETMPYKECKSCLLKKKHRFLNSSFTTQGLFEDYRKYFLKETNSELGLGFTMYEKYFNKNCNYTISDADTNGPNCPRCIIDLSKS